MKAATKTILLALVLTLSLTATASNPLYEKVSTRTTQEDIAGTTSTDDNATSYGLVWDPNITFAVVTWF